MTLDFESFPIIVMVGVLANNIIETFMPVESIRLWSYMKDKNKCKFLTYKKDE